MVCYLTNWAFYRKSSGKFVPENVDQQLCTYVVYAFASLDPESLIMKAFDPWADFDNSELTCRNFFDLYSYIFLNFLRFIPEGYIAEGYHTSFIAWWLDRFLRRQILKISQ